ncbi:dephospho-CoA kinase [Kiloniella antarctica]|uniref:Dephospho-CoA kinase n=1 Tax=Kiloniella antarctica TaxID=1550907 RepID=A0ABW5BJN9_9PROT
MYVLGLTGSIGMGKSTAAEIFRRLKVPVHDADAAVHQLLGYKGAAVKSIEAIFPNVVQNDAVDRKKLGDEVFGHSKKLKQLEAVLHPLVRKKTHEFLGRNAHQRRKLVVLDIPLLFETEGYRFCDGVLVVSSPSFIQDQRVMSRKGMTASKYGSILKKQMPDSEKRALADYVIQSNQGKRHSYLRVKQLVDVLSTDVIENRGFSPHLSLICQ